MSVGPEEDAQERVAMCIGQTLGQMLRASPLCELELRGPKSTVDLTDKGPFHPLNQHWQKWLSPCQGRRRDAAETLGTAQCT
ncbi:hypothetical protein P7K49_027673, partial [Saguinus oedipus]